MEPAGNSPVGSATGRGVRNSTPPRAARAGSYSFPGTALGTASVLLKLSQGIQLPPGGSREACISRGETMAPRACAWRDVIAAVPPVRRVCVHAEERRRLAAGDLPFPDRPHRVRQPVRKTEGRVVARGAGDDLVEHQRALARLLAEGRPGEEQILPFGDELLPLGLGVVRRRALRLVALRKLLPERPFHSLEQRVQGVGGGGRRGGRCERQERRRSEHHWHRQQETRTAEAPTRHDNPPPWQAELLNSYIAARNTTIARSSSARSSRWSRTDRSIRRAIPSAERPAQVASSAFSRA